MPVKLVLLATLPAALVAAVFIAASWRPWKPPKAGAGWWGSALALGLGYIVADRLVWNTWPEWRPVEEHRWLPAIGLLGAAFGLCEPLWRSKSWRGYAFAAIAAASLVPLLSPDSSHPSVGPGSLLPLALWTVVTCVVWMETEESARARTGALVPVMCWASATGASLVTIQSNATQIGFTAAAIAAMMGPLVLLAWWRPSLNAVAAATPAFALLLVGTLLANSSTYVEAKVLVALSAITPALVTRGPLRRLPPWMAVLACLFLSAALIVLATGWFTAWGFHFGESESAARPDSDSPDDYHFLASNEEIRVLVSKRACGTPGRRARA